MLHDTSNEKLYACLTIYNKEDNKDIAHFRISREFIEFEEALFNYLCYFTALKWTARMTIPGWDSLSNRSL